MKILIVSGFLGAGKTTFIKALAKHTGKEFAILENEYGAAGIDKDRLETELASGTVNIWEMTEGCICCSAKGDFACLSSPSLMPLTRSTWSSSPPGVGKLGNIVENLKQIEYDRITLLAPVTVVDIHSYPALFAGVSGALPESDCGSWYDSGIQNRAGIRRRKTADLLCSTLHQSNCPDHHGSLFSSSS